jgi:hypothetical protein
MGVLHKLNFQKPEVEVALRLVLSPLSDLRQDITSCRNVLSESCGLVSVGRPL